MALDSGIAGILESRSLPVPVASRKGQLPFREAFGFCGSVKGLLRDSQAAMSLSDAWLGEGDAAAGEAQEEASSKINLN